MTSFIRDTKTQYLRIETSFKKVNSLVFSPPFFVFDKLDFSEYFGISKTYCVELYEYFDTRNTELEEIKNLLDYFEKENYIREYSFSPTAKAFRLLKEASFSDDILGLEEIDFKLANIIFYGGRNEYYVREYSGNLIYIDINSSYGFCLTLPLPDKKQRKIFKNISLRELRELDREGFFGAVKVIAYEENNFPRLPVRVKMKGSEYGYETFYPKGKIEGWYTTNDILLFDDEEDVKIPLAVLYKRREFFSLKEKIFELFVQKKTGNEIERQMAKKEIVHIYGLLSKRTPVFNRLIGAFVSSFNRRRIYKAMRKIEAKGGKVLYVDTDGILFSTEGLSEKEILSDFFFSDTLGSWSIRTKARKVEIGAVKQYALYKGNDEIELRWKGVRIKDTKILELDIKEGYIVREYIRPFSGETVIEEIRIHPFHKRKFLNESESIPYSISELKANAMSVF